MQLEIGMIFRNVKNGSLWSVGHQTIEPGQKSLVLLLPFKDGRVGSAVFRTVVTRKTLGDKRRFHEVLLPQYAKEGMVFEDCVVENSGSAPVVVVQDEPEDRTREYDLPTAEDLISQGVRLLLQEHEDPETVAMLACEMVASCLPAGAINVTEVEDEFEEFYGDGQSSHDPAEEVAMADDLLDDFDGASWSPPGDPTFRPDRQSPGDLVTSEVPHAFHPLRETGGYVHRPAKPRQATPGKPDGSMPFRFMGFKGELFGGPYWNKPVHMEGVKMAEEIPLPCSVDVPTRDFDVPPVFVMQQGLLDTFEMILEGHEVYVGCMGGIGRTGLFMAAFAKMVGIRNPVAHVRVAYKAHAVETKQQMEYIEALDVGKLRWECRKMAFRKLLGLNKS